LVVRPRYLIGAGLAGLAGAAVWWRKNPSACPYGQRFWIETPHPIITRGRLLGILRPQPGERILEIGPGTGYYSLDVAEALKPDGTLDILDIQPEMLDHTMGRAAKRGIDNIVPHHGNAEELPFPDGTFDAVYLVTVLGEVPDQVAALKEVSRVLQPLGRAVFGELLGDPHVVTLGQLRSRAAGARLVFQERSGNSIGYFARFHPI
jgi:ubiquinone/menaquinone biosynthesis C-methylase UbiE